MQTLASFSCVDWLRRAARAPSLVVALCLLAVPGTAASADVPGSAWIIDGTGAAIQIFDCSGRLCGRIIWLHKAYDAVGQLAHDNKNPDPAFRQRPLCGLTILQGLQPAGLGHWNSGWLYNPDDGRTYRVSAELRSADVFTARIYLGAPLFGETKTLQRVTRLGLEGWCLSRSKLSAGLRSGCTAGKQHGPPGASCRGCKPQVSRARALFEKSSPRPIGRR